MFKLEDTLKNLVSWFKENCWIIFCSLIVSLIAHFQLYSNELTHPDGILAWLEFRPQEWELSLGRWGWTYIMALRGYLVSPMLSTAIALLCYVLSGVLLSDLFGIKNAALRICICLLVSCSPVAAVTVMSYFCSDAFAIAFMLAILSVVCIEKIHNDWFAIFFASIMVALALSIYQSNLGVAAMAGVMLIFISIYNRCDWHKILRKVRNIFIMGICGVGIYYILLQVFLKIHNVEMSAYKGANNISLSYIIENLGRSIHNAYIDFFKYFCGGSITINSYSTIFFYRAIFILFIIGLIVLFIQKKDSIRSSLLVLFLAVMPLMANLIDIAAPDTTIVTLTAVGLALTLPFCVSVIWRVFNTTKYSYSFKVITVFLCLCIIWNYILIANVDAVVLQVQTNKNVELAARVYKSLEEAGFSTGDKVIIIGKPEDGNYPTTVILPNRVNSYINYYGLMWSGGQNSIVGWGNIMYRFFGLNIYANQSYSDVMNNGNMISESQEFKEMPIYPDFGSIKKFDDIFVVKMSN